MCFEKRNFNTETGERFKCEISTFNMETNRNANELYNGNIDFFRNLCDKHFPEREFKVKSKHVGKPYITAAIKYSIKQRM